MLRDLLLVLNMLVCLALIGVVLLQRSEGGAFGTGSPTGLVTARGAGDLLTRTTWVLFSLFLTLSLALTLVGGRERSSEAILERLKNATVNPDLLSKPAAPPSAPTGAPLTAPGQSPSQSAPPALQLPALGAPSPAKPHAERSARTEKPSAASAQRAPIGQVTQPAPALATSAPLALPPLTTTPASPPAKTPGP